VAPAEVFTDLDRLTAEAAPADRPTLVLAPGSARTYSTAFAGLQTLAPAARCGCARSVEVAAGRDGYTSDGTTTAPGSHNGAAGRGDAEGSPDRV
jgi:hypothetical protein